MRIDKDQMDSFLRNSEAAKVHFFVQNDKLLPLLNSTNHPAIFM